MCSCVFHAIHLNKSTPSSSRICINLLNFFLKDDYGDLVMRTNILCTTRLCAVACCVRCLDFVSYLARVCFVLILVTVSTVYSLTMLTCMDLCEVKDIF